MCPSDDSNLTLEFDDHYVIQPAIVFTHPRDYEINPLGEKGTAVEEGFQYKSSTNPHFLTVDELRSMQS